MLISSPCPCQIPWASLRAAAVVCGLGLGVSSLAFAGDEPRSAPDRPTVILDAGLVRADVLGAPMVREVSRVAPDTLVVVVQAQSVEHGHQERYEPRAGDEIVLKRQHRVLVREGLESGWLVGIRQDVLQTPDELMGDPLDLAWADDAENYAVRVAGEADSEPIHPVRVYRVSRPFDHVRAAGNQANAAVHHLYLRFARPLSDNANLLLNFKGERLASSQVAFDGDWRSARSEAVHVSQIGFRPDDPIKVAYLSTWLGDGGAMSYPEELPFALVADDSGETVFQGHTQWSQPVSAPGNVSGTDVYRMDFSAVTRPGIYRVVVEGVGGSFPFPIRADAWTTAFATGMRGIYSQRSGIALGPPVTPFLRPRSFRPEDGVRIYASDTAPGPLGDATGNRFQRLLAGRTDEVLPDAWGGWMDAGDWDRRHDHMLMPLSMFDLLEMLPEAMEKVDYVSAEIEGEERLPDLAREALWGVDFWQRMQEPNGAVRGGIESAAHPRMGEASWQESLLVMAFAPTVQSSLDFASIATRASWWLRERKPKKAQGYLESALRAMAWVETQPQEERDAKRDHLALASAELYRVTGDGRWHELFVSVTRFQKDGAPFCTNPQGAVKDAQSAAAWTYLQTRNRPIDETVRSRILAALEREAEDSVRRVNSTDFNFAGGAERTIIWGALSIPETNTLVRAHFMTGKPEYLEAIILSAQTGAGANPLNMCYTTGLGQRWPQNPLHEDARRSRQPLYAGITLGGPIKTGLNRQQAAPNFEVQLHPDANLWPAAESFFDVYAYPAMCEFTVHQTMMPTNFVWGYLAGRR